MIMNNELMIMIIMVMMMLPHCENLVKIVIDWTFTTYCHYFRTILSKPVFHGSKKFEIGFRQ